MVRLSSSSSSYFVRFPLSLSSYPFYYRFLTFLLYFLSIPLSVNPWRQYTTWSDRQWCEQVVDPLWPYAYDKFPGSPLSASGMRSSAFYSEHKGRTASNYQNMEHICDIRGVESKCYRCEPIACGTDLSSICQYQLQGVLWDELPKNIPTITDSPFAVGPLVLHRHDFAHAERICVITSGQECVYGTNPQDPIKNNYDYSHCAIRCWGANSPTEPIPTVHGWTYNPNDGLPQGKIFTVAGKTNENGGGSGFRDGIGSNARFSNPQGVAVDKDRYVYVCDTYNHAIRQIDPNTGMVTTLTGKSGKAGYRDGSLSTAQFSHPVGIAVYEDCFHTFDNEGKMIYDPETLFAVPSLSGSCETTLIIADTGNHRIRRILLKRGYVSTIAGGGNTTFDEMEKQAHGLSDGYAHFARFNTPMGLTVDSVGNIFVTDTRNHVIRWIDPHGQVLTLTGKVIPAMRELPGCPWPCLQGVPGYLDANMTESKFYSPYSIAIGPGNPYTLVVADGDRIRLISRNNKKPFADTLEIGGQGYATGATRNDILSFDTVYTLAGALDDGQKDGHGFEAKLDKPRGVIMSADGRIYFSDSLRCRIRSITVGVQAARRLSCKTRLVDAVRPSGCTSYDPPVDSVDRTVTDVYAHIHYNYNVSQIGGRFDGLNSLTGNLSTVRRTAMDKTVLGDGYLDQHIDGRRLPFCLGIPPWDLGNTSSRETLGPVNGTGANPFDMDEDSGHGTTLLIWCPPGCGTNPSPVYGIDDYADESSICTAAIHAGITTDTDGGVIVITLRKGIGMYTGGLARGPMETVPGNTRNTVTSLPLLGTQRTFTIEAYPLPWQATEVETLAGVPAAPLDPSCGYMDGQPPQAARFNGPSGIAVYVNRSLTDSEVLIIADSHNHVIRAMTAVCSQTCENGGRCIGPQKCQCLPGWSGTDCSVPVCTGTPCGPRTICTAPNTCTCIPGYSGANCNVPLCVQTCEHGGLCTAPDTCGCQKGWFDANCTTPVCTQTCGNGGNCTAPDTCTCPGMWQGDDCRVPVCIQVCLNGGFCSAPDTCTCTPDWSGHDCSKPVCHQGFFRADPYPQGSAPPSTIWREPRWLQFEPCEYEDWCTATNEFECFQLQRSLFDIVLPPVRNYSGKADIQTPLSTCFPIELGLIDKVPYRMENELGNLTKYARFTPITPYGWGPTRYTNPWSASSYANSDRQVAMVSYKTVTQGVYVCANGGNCTAPDTCVCAPGWIGYDCRIPVCRQGYYYPDVPDIRYPGQGTYVGSPRTLTIWENPATPNYKFTEYVHTHPNFHSIAIDMDAQLGYDETHTFQPGPGSIQPPEYTVYEGWRLFGWWNRNTDQRWKHGKFSSTYDRTCPYDTSKQLDLRNNVYNIPVNDTNEAFHPRINYTDETVISVGRWYETGGECIDHVLLGCFNEGICTSPNTCQCAAGWEGDDCSLPICTQTVAEINDVKNTEISVTLLRLNGINYGNERGQPPLPGDQYIGYRKCPNNGNCTRPDTCTCEKGWTGTDCTVPMCIQECFHNGFCSAPDTCTCPQNPTIFIDARGVPLFRKPDGDAQSTGWTGFDCNTPICVQAAAWILNDDTGSRLVSLLKDSGRPLANDGTVFQGGCSAGGDYIPEDIRTRVSDTLCGQAVWYMGNFDEPWANDELTSRKSAGRTVRVNFPNYYKDRDNVWRQGEEVAGEGLYACYNNGACTAPDTCTCADGWSGYDCNVPLCTYTDIYGDTIVGCRYGGICYDVNLCKCTSQQSLLYLLHDEPLNVETGWTAKDCSMAICTQGYFDPDCRGVPPGVGGVASMGQGCYRCDNGGNCTAPDVCTCPVQWTGYDCRTPVCVQHATRQTIADLNTIDVAVIEAFEYDPCGSTVMEEWGDKEVSRGNCTRPNTCTCLCKVRAYRGPDGQYNDVPWIDPLSRALPPGYIFGRFDCIDGFEGNLNPDGTFSSCHLRIYVPTWLERYSLIIIIVSVIVFVAVTIAYMILRRQLKRRFLQIKADRRRTRRMQEESEKAEQAEEEKKKKVKKRGKA